jgi:hypothetical protein
MKKLIKNDARDVRDVRGDRGGRGQASLPARSLFLYYLYLTILEAVSMTMVKEASARLNDNWGSIIEGNMYRNGIVDCIRLSN